MQKPTMSLSNVSVLATPKGLHPAPEAPSLQSSTMTPVAAAAPASLQEDNICINHTPRMCVGIVEEAKLN